MSKFRKFLLKLAKDLAEENITDLKFLHDDSIPSSELNDVTSCTELMSLFLKHDIIREDSLITLIENLKDVDREDLAKRCIVYQSLMNRTTGKCCFEILT